MPFNIRNFDAITASLIASVSSGTIKTTDFNVGSVVRTMLEAVALTMEDLNINTWQGLLDAIETAVYKGFDFKRLQPSKSSGVVRFISDVPAVATVVIPVGTLVKVPGTSKEYVTTIAGQIDIGETETSIRVEATVEGSVANTTPDSVTELVAPLTGVDSITNNAAFSSGRDLETSLERRDRFRRFIVSLARSHREGIEFAARTAVILDANDIVIESVTDVFVFELFTVNPTAPAGYFDVFIHSGPDTSAEIVAEAQKIIDGFEDPTLGRVAGFRAAGDVASVKAAEEIIINVDADIIVSEGFSFAELEASIIDSIVVIFEASKIAQDFLVNDIICSIKAVSGVFDVIMNTPTANVTIAFNQVGILGTITLTETTI